MNKKLFTLAAALMMGSAFTVNAQSNQPDAGTKFDGKVYYFLGDGTNFIGADADQIVDKTDAQKFTKVELGNLAKAKANKNYYLWSVSLSAPVNGQIYVTFTNKASGMPLAFKADGSAIASRAEYDEVNAVKQMVWAGIGDSDLTDETTVYDDYLEDGGSLIIGVDDEDVMYLGVNSGAWKETNDDDYAVAIKLFTENASDPIAANTLNDQLGNGFSFDFVDLTTQPSNNIFGQKLYAFDLNKVDANTYDWSNGVYAAGTYFATTPQPEDVTESADVQNWFLTTQFIAVSPVEHLGIPALEQKDGKGFKLVTVYGKDLKDKDDLTSKKEVSSLNAAFTVTKPSPVNEPNNYTLAVSPRVKTEASKDGQSGTTQVIVLSKVMGENYVTTSTTLKDAAKVKLGSGNILAAKDLLKKDGASVYNILFVSGADQTPDNPKEYGKYLGIMADRWFDLNNNQVRDDGETIDLVAQGPSFVDLNNAEMQWVITDASSAGDFTFTNRENGSEFKTKLRKTDKENVFEVAMPDLAVAHVYSGSYYTKFIHATSMTIELKPATVDKTYGYADYSEEELNQLVKLQFEVGSNVVSKNIYVAAKPTAYAGGEVSKMEIYASQNIAEAAQWELIKRTGISDTIYSDQKYAYLDKDGKVQKDKEFNSHEIVTYSIKLYQDGTAFYYGAAANGELVPASKLILAPRFAIKENADGTIALISVGSKTDYTFGKNALGIVYDGTFTYSESIYSLLDQKSNLFFGTEDATPSLAAVSRHASFKSVNGGFLGVGAEGDAIIAATKDEAQELTFWLDTTDVEKYTPSFYISQGIKAETKADAAEVRNFLFNAKDSVSYYDEGTASTVINKDYLLNTGETKAIFKAGTLVNKDSLNTIVAGKEVGLNNANGLRNFKFNIVLADADVADEYVIKSVADNNYVANINGKVALVDVPEAALVVKLGAGDATANEAIAAESGVQVIGGQGVVTVQGAAGKVITVANILGQTIANQVATSDNVTIAVPAGIAVVAVDGEATKVVVK